MNPGKTQFAVAVIGAASLAAITLATLVGYIITESDALEGILQMEVGGIIGLASTAGAWLFRLNGKANGSKQG